VSAVVGFLSLMVLSYATNSWLLIIAAILFGAGYGTVMPCLQTWTVQKVSEAKSGAANATFLSSFDSGVGISAFLLGLLAEWMSVEMIFRLVSLSFLLVALFVYIDAKRTRKNNHIQTTKF